VHNVARVIIPAGIERPVVPVPATHFTALVVLLGAGAALFIRLLTTLIISHNLLSFPLLMLVALPPHHPVWRRILVYQNAVETGKRRVGDFVAEARALSIPFWIQAGVLRPEPLILRSWPSHAETDGDDPDRSG
jgi:hypothetical protein